MAEICAMIDDDMLKNIGELILELELYQLLVEVGQ